MNDGWLRFAERQFFFSIVCSLVLFLVIMAAEFLHYISDGKIPRLIEWKPAQTYRFEIDGTEDDETDQSDPDGPEQFYFDPGPI